MDDEAVWLINNAAAGIPNFEAVVRFCQRPFEPTVKPSETHKELPGRCQERTGTIVNVTLVAE
jgi:hypothetical protein